MIKMNAAVLFLLSILLVGCSVEGKNDFGSYYQKQASLDLLKMPPGIQAEDVDNYYIVPPGPMADVKTVSILPPGSRAFESAVAKQQAKSGDKSPAIDTSKSAAVATPIAAPQSAEADAAKSSPEGSQSVTPNTTGNS